MRDIAGDLAPHDVTTIQFADDISLRASSPQPEVVSQRLTVAVQYLATWLKKRGLILNETKTQILAIPHHRAAALDINIVCNSQVLPVVTSAKYLGLHFDSDMSWTMLLVVLPAKLLSCCDSPTSDLSFCLNFCMLLLVTTRI